MTFNRSNTGICTNGGTLFSDLVSLPSVIPSGAYFWTRYYVANPEGVPYEGENICNDSTGGFFDSVSDTSRDTTDLTGPVTWNGLGAITQLPLAIIGITKKPSVYLTGDSRMSGLRDTPDATLSFGYGRLVPLTTGTANMGAPSDTLSGWLEHHTQRMLLTPYATHVISDYGYNDITELAIPMPELKVEISDFCNTVALPVCWTTMAPDTSTGYGGETGGGSSNGWATVKGQRENLGRNIPNDCQSREALNMAMRAQKIPGIATYLDVDAAVESLIYHGAWKANGLPFTYTPDGLHESWFGLFAERTTTSVRVLRFINGRR
jgi:hypothetical protein